jgi:glutathione peroxidase
MTTVYDFTAKPLGPGEPISLEQFKGQVLLVVNTASKCGMTPHYAGLEMLYEKYHDKGFSVLGFPCNQFGHQEPGTAEEIRSFCDTSYNITFPMFSKIDVNGDNTHPLYAYLKQAAPGVLGTKDIKWNFTKFMIGRDGHAMHRYAPTTTPESIEGDLVKILS